VERTRFGGKEIRSVELITERWDILIGRIGLEKSIIR
jgi:hypothetical protein